MTSVRRLCIPSITTSTPSPPVLLHPVTWGRKLTIPNLYADRRNSQPIPTVSRKSKSLGDCVKRGPRARVGREHYRRRTSGGTRGVLSDQGVVRSQSSEHIADSPAACPLGAQHEIDEPSNDLVTKAMSPPNSPTTVSYGSQSVLLTLTKLILRLPLCSVDTVSAISVSGLESKDFIETATALSRSADSSCTSISEREEDTCGSRRGDQTALSLKKARVGTKIKLRKRQVELKCR